MTFFPVEQADPAAPTAAIVATGDVHNAGDGSHAHLHGGFLPLPERVGKGFDPFWLTGLTGDSETSSYESLILEVRKVLESPVSPVI